MRCCVCDNVIGSEGGKTNFVVVSEYQHDLATIGKSRQDKHKVHGAIDGFMITRVCWDRPQYPNASAIIKRHPPTLNIPMGFADIE